MALKNSVRLEVNDCVLSESIDFMFLGEGWMEFDIANPNSKSYGLFF